MYSIEYRKVCIRLYSHFKSFRKVAKLVGVGASSICRWINMDLTATKPRKERQRSYNYPVVIDAIKCFLHSLPLATINDVKEAVKPFFNVPVSTELIRLIVHEAGYSRKKPRFYASPKHKQEKTEEFIKRKEALKNRLIIPIDETGFSSNIRPLYGYSVRGKRLHISYKPTSKEIQHVSVVAAADPRNGKLYTSQLKGHYTKERFLEFLQSLTFPKKTVNRRIVS